MLGQEQKNWKTAFIFGQLETQDLSSGFSFSVFQFPALVYLIRPERRTPCLVLSAILSLAENATECIPSQNQDPRSKIRTEVLWKILDLVFARTSLSQYQSKILARSLVEISDLGFEQECSLNALNTFWMHSFQSYLAWSYLACRSLESLDKQVM